MQDNEKRCPVCTEEVKTDPVETHGRYSIYQCHGCGLQFADPLEYNPENYNEVFENDETKVFSKKSSENYRRSLSVLCNETDLLRCIDYTMLPSYQQLAIRWLRDNIPQNAYVFDLGCSTGRFLIALQREGFRSFGMDIAAKPIKILKEKGFQVAVGSIEDYPSSWPEPAAITLFEVLEHLPDPVNFLKNILRRFPNSPLLLSVPSPRRYARKKDAADYPPDHLTRWTEKALSLALERAGYDSIVVFPKVISNEITGTGIGRLIAMWRNWGGPKKAKSMCNENLVSLDLEKRLSHLKKWFYAPLCAYLNLRGYSGLSMVGIATPKIKKNEK